jgi:hypothetical protein
LPVRGIARAADEQGESALEPLDQHRGRKRSHAGCRELNRKRQPIQTLAYHSDGLIGFEPGAHGTCAFDEECLGVVD